MSRAVAVTAAVVCAASTSIGAQAPSGHREVFARYCVSCHTEAQKARYLPPIVEGRALWCQGFSEPGAGSDLASLRTRAVLDGDVYRVTGQKIWTSYAGLADTCFLVCRTSDDRKRGISILIVPMDTPGITVRQIPSLIGEGDIHEVFFDDMVVPVTGRLGEEGEAWSIIAYSLTNERLGIPRSLADLGLTAADVDRAVDVALGAPYANPRPASADDLRAVLHAAWAGDPPYGG